MGKILGFLVILIIIVALVYILLGKFGSFFGDEGGGDGDNGSAVSVVEAENSEQIGESEENGGGEAIEYADITVTGSAYVYNGDVMELEAFIEEAGKLDERVIVRITDDGATQNSMEDLKKALEDKGRKFVIDESENSN